MTKPIKPIEPNIEDYPLPKEPNGFNIYKEPIYQRLEYYADCKKYHKELEKYNKDIEQFEQLKMIRLVKNSSEEYCLKNLKISKKEKNGSKV